MIKVPGYETDSGLVNSLREGDEKAYMAFVRAYQKPLMRFLRKRNIQNNSIEDITQETFVKVYKNIDRFRENSKFGAWIYTIARNLAFDHHGKKNLLFLEDLGRQSKKVLDVKDRYDAIDNLRIVEDLLNKVDEDKLKPLKMYAFDGYSYQEIADNLEIPIGTVMSKIFHARKQLAKHLEKLGY